MMCFWGGDNCALLLMHKEALSRGGVRVHRMRIQLRSGWPRFSGRRRRTERDGFAAVVSPLHLSFVVVGAAAKKGGGWATTSEFGREEVGGAAAGGEREFAVIALTGFRAVNDSGLSAYQFVSVLAVY